MGCSDKLMKFILIIVNLIFLLSSLLMLALGIALASAPSKVISFVESNGLDISVFSDATGGLFMDIIRACAIFMIILGSIVVLLSFFGFVGACCENSCLLGVYSVILGVIVLAEIALIIFAAAYPNEFRKKGSEFLYTTLTGSFKSDLKIDSQGRFQNSTQAVDLAWAAIQFKLSCCGANNSTDYNKFQWERCGPVCTQGVVPMSCCKLKDTSKFPTRESDFVNFNACVGSANPDPTATNMNGCAGTVIDRATDSIKQYGKIAIGIAAGIVALEIILIIFSIVLCCRGSKSV